MNDKEIKLTKESIEKPESIGFLTGNMPVGLFGGLGIGFIAMAIAYFMTGEW